MSSPVGMMSFVSTPMPASTRPVRRAGPPSAVENVSTRPSTPMGRLSADVLARMSKTALPAQVTWMSVMRPW